jgi:hypothetical protein
MAVRKAQPRKPEQSAVDLAIAAIEGRPNPLDMDMTGIDPDPTSLDLPQEGDGYFTGEMCSNPRCTRRTVDACSGCGSPLCEECVGLPGTEG